MFNRTILDKKFLEQYSIFKLAMHNYWLQLLVLLVVASSLYLPSLYNFSQNLSTKHSQQQQLYQLKHKVSQNSQISVAVTRQKEQLIAKQSGLVVLPLKKKLEKLLLQYQINDFSIDFNFNQGLTAQLNCSTNFRVFQQFLQDLIQQQPSLDLLDLSLTPQIETNNLAISLSFYP